MIMKAEYIGGNMKRLVNKNFSKLEKEYRDCIKRKWRQDWDMNETL